MSRLIDAGMVISIAKGEFGKDDLSKILWLISHVPTAHYQDKVVEQLEEKILEIKDRLMYTRDEDVAVRLRCKMHGLDEALEVVKGGGMNE